MDESCLFWGKFKEGEGRCLSLVCHCLDVAIVFRNLCELPGIRRALETAGKRALKGRDLDRLAVLALLHDVGKVNLGFQFKVFPDSPFEPAGHMAELAVLEDEPRLAEAFAEALQMDGLTDWFNPQGCGLESFFFASWSHHGLPFRFDRGVAAKAMTWTRYWQRYRDHDPMVGVVELMAWAREAFPLAFEGGGEPLPAQPRFQHLFAGLVMLADWLGSHPHWFPIESIHPKDRLRHDRHTVPRQLRAIGLDARPLRSMANAVPSAFEERFPFSPHPLQRVVHDQDPADPATRLLIVESETGSGKTEAALDWFLTLFAAGQVDGLYFALPTRVAARELYQRVHRTLRRWFPDPAASPVTVLAVPGYAQVDGLSLDQILPRAEAANIWQDDEQARRQERLWAIEHPKRFLAATAAVGTIDQALLSAVQTKHAHLRGVCLSRSLMVVDEVHASDRYMTRLLEHLLTHHLAVGGRAILLSATLGAEARERYLAVAQGQNPNRVVPPSLESARGLVYPRLTRADGSARNCGHDDRSKAVCVEEVTSAFHPETLAERLIQALSADARVMVVMNTVDRANALHRALEAHPQMDPRWNFRCREVPCPHHGCFAPQDRLVLDAAVSARMGRESPAGPVLLIGTQTLEQSLDIDADLLVSDLAPADVLLQRIGRLHRHRRPRPPGFEVPRCLLLIPDTALAEALDGQGHVDSRFGRLGYGSVYPDLRALELTRRYLTEAGDIVIPRDNRPLVEAATHPESLQSLEEEDRRWVMHGQHVEGGDIEKGLQAEYVQLPFQQCFGDFTFNELGLKVATRLGADALRLPLNRAVISPFGQPLDELTIPDQLAPKRPDDILTVEGETEDVIHLRCGERHYTYSRHGLEKKEDP